MYLRYHKRERMFNFKYMMASLIVARATVPNMISLGEASSTNRNVIFPVPLENSVWGYLAPPALIAYAP